MNIASIDIGTNTLLLTIADLNSKGELNILTDKHDIARLGENLIQSGEIQLPAIERAKTILLHYKEICNQFNVEKIKIVGTSALREAKNRDYVINILSDVIDNEISVISGEEEAKLSFMGAVEDNENSGVIDIGGGSSEIIFGNIDKINYKVSLPFGVVKLKEKFVSGFPINLHEIVEIEEEIQRFLRCIDEIPIYDKIYAVAGTPTSVAAAALGINEFDYQKIDGYILTKTILENVKNKFLLLTPSEIVSNFGLHPQRADLIGVGAIILSEITNLLKIDNIIVSVKGLRYGVLKSLANQIRN